MYRYLLFFYYDFYPEGGMNDCVLKTNNFNDMEKYINENLSENWYLGTISYYDTAEDKTWDADMRFDEIGYIGYFVGWEESK